MTKAVLMYQADDGRLFDSEEKSNAWEKRGPETRLVGLTDLQIKAAIDGHDDVLSDAIQVLGSKMQRDRLKRGVRKHAPANKKRPPAPLANANTEG